MLYFKIIEAKNPLWCEVIKTAYQYDFYHTRFYSLLINNYQPLLFICYCDDDYIAIPLVLRKIQRTEFFDITSPYGYCGPISNRPMETVSPILIKYFHESLISYCIDNKIVTLFSRLHPLIKSDPLLTGLGKIRFINYTVAIDLTLPCDEQLRRYRRNHRQDIYKLRKNNFAVEMASDKKAIMNFIELYYNSMSRLNANESYYFEYDYFNKFLNNPYFASKLLLAKKNKQIVGGGIFTFTNGIMQHHLGGDVAEFRKWSPSKLIIDEARLMGCNLNMKILHLGGGYQGNNGGTLLHYKLGFSDLTYEFKGWEVIIDNNKYEYLIDLFNIERIDNKDYFPLYRANERSNGNCL